MQAFSLDRESGIPVRLQFMAHVKLQVATGLLYPGDQLPPLRDLAAGLGINLNTVVRAVDQLIDEGYLYSHQGKGIFVADEPPGPMPGAALRSLLAGVLGPARDWGLSPEDAALALLAQGQMARAPLPVTRRLLLIGSCRADLRGLQRQLELALPGVAVVAALPEEAPRPGSFKVGACSLFHSIAGQAGPDPVVLAGAAEIDLWQRFLALPAGAPVVVAAGDWVQAARVRQSLESLATAPARRFTLVTRPEALPAALADAQFLLAVQSGLALADAARSIRPDLPSLVEPVHLPTDALGIIRRRLGGSGPTPQVQIRSSWV